MKELINCVLCDSKDLYSVDNHDSDCTCGGIYCIDCDAEYNKKGELIAYGEVIK